MSKRVNKFISESGYCSRREADRLIAQNRVLLNGAPPELGMQVEPGDDVRIDGQKINAIEADKSDRVYLAYHKPVGVICVTDPEIKDNIIDAVNYPQRIFPIGRIDKPSEGLMLLTNDGDIVNKILRAENAHDKEYVVSVDKPITNEFIQKMAQGVAILGTVTKPCQVQKKHNTVFTIVLTQGLNRQIRRMCEVLGYRVTRLRRVRIMNIQLGDLAAGQWRHLSDSEMQHLNQSLQGSTKTAMQKADQPAHKKPQNLTKKEYFAIKQKS